MSGIVSIESSATALSFALGDLHGKEIPYATQQALNEVAFKTQRAEKSEMAHALELRNRFSQTGVQVNKADKDDWPTTYAEVGIEEKRSYLIDHILGGKRQGGRHGRAILADTSTRSRTGRVPSSKRPAALVENAARSRRQAELNRTFGAKRTRDKRLPFCSTAASGATKCWRSGWARRAIRCGSSTRSQNASLSAPTLTSRESRPRQWGQATIRHSSAHYDAP